jgi:hypothetical protein
LRPCHNGPPSDPERCRWPMCSGASTRSPILQTPTAQESHMHSHSCHPTHTTERTREGGGGVVGMSTGTLDFDTPVCTARDLRTHMHTRIRVHLWQQGYECVRRRVQVHVHALASSYTGHGWKWGERAPDRAYISSRQVRSYVQAHPHTQLAYRRLGHACTYLASGREPVCRSRMRHPFTILQSIAVIVGNGGDLYMRCARIIQPDAADSTREVADTLRRGAHPLVTHHTRHQRANMPVP